MSRIFRLLLCPLLGVVHGSVGGVASENVANRSNEPAVRRVSPMCCLASRPGNGLTPNTGPQGRYANAIGPKKKNKKQHKKGKDQTDRQSLPFEMTTSTIRYDRMTKVFCFWSAFVRNG
uniref:Putative secreted protein n=1 Tax=Anopheles darlingi TaxID=43151 RepID=A0A2M4D9F8_ANODA